MSMILQKGILQSSQLGCKTHLTSEALPFLRLQEAVVHLVGTGNYRRHRVLVAGRDNGKERESSQG